MLPEQTIVELREHRPTMSIRELAIKYGVGINTIAKYTFGIPGSKGVYGRTYKTERGKTFASVLRNERKLLRRRIKEIDRALRNLVR